MADKKNELPNVIDQLKDYMNTRFKQISYQAAVKVTAVSADAVAALAIMFCYLLTFFLLSVTMGLFLASLLGSGWAGFSCLALLYLLITITIVVFKKKFERPVVNIFIHKIIK